MVHKEHENERVGKGWTLTYSVRTLIVLCACVACYLAGHRRGYHTAMASWNSIPIMMITYGVGDLVSSDQYVEKRFDSTDELISLLRSEIVPSAWQENGGNCKIMAMPNGSIHVSANTFVHDQISHYLEAARLATQESGRTVR